MKTKASRYPLKKLDKDGNFSHFPGITIVSHGYSQQPSFCQKIYRALFENTEINEHYSLLPAKSYHMTEVNLCNEAALETEWKSFVLDNIDNFRAINAELRKHPIQPMIEKIEVASGETIMLVVSLPESQVEKIKDMASSLGISEGIPEVFHVTLAYARPQKKPSMNVAERLEEVINEHLNTILLDTTLPMSFGLATLCYFNDMTAFHPWHVEDYPFQEPIASSSTVVRSRSACSFFNEQDQASLEQPRPIASRKKPHEI